MVVESVVSSEGEVGSVVPLLIGIGGSYRR